MPRQSTNVYVVWVVLSIIDTNPAETVSNNNYLRLIKLCQRCFMVASRGDVNNLISVLMSSIWRLLDYGCCDTHPSHPSSSFYEKIYFTKNN